MAAILSAIAGYILGKTAPPKSDKILEMELETLRLEERLAEEKRLAEKAEKEDPTDTEPSEEK